jgi:hypothetical protein
MTVDTATAAEQLGMAIIPMPPGSTGKCQPIDVRVFGVLKRKQSKLYDNAMCACPGLPWVKADAVRTIIDAWAQIDASVVKSAWRLTAVRSDRGRCALGEAEGA